MDCSTSVLEFACAQRHDGVEIRYVPAFLEHVHVDNDFRGVVRLLHVDQLLDGFVSFLPLCWSSP